MSINVRVCSGRNPRAAAVLTEILGTEPDIGVCQCVDCDTGRHAPAPQAVVTVTGFPELADLAQVEALRKRHPQAYLVVLSMCEDSMLRTWVLEAGADRFMLLDEAVPALAQAIRQHCLMRRPRAAMMFPHGVAS